MTKTKKLNKIIPAVLLSGAMVISTPHLISPTIVNALENNNSNNYADEACPLTFKFYSNGDDGQALYVKENTTSTQKSENIIYNNKEITITPNGGETKKGILIENSDKVSSLKINITKSTNAAKYLAKSNAKLKVEFYLNGDRDNPIYVLKKENGRVVKHINSLIIDGNKEQNVFIDGLSGLNGLEIKVSKI